MFYQCNEFLIISFWSDCPSTNLIWLKQKKADFILLRKEHVWAKMTPNDVHSRCHFRIYTRTKNTGVKSRMPSYNKRFV